MKQKASNYGKKGSVSEERKRSDPYLYLSHWKQSQRGQLHLLHKLGQGGQSFQTKQTSRGV